MSSQSQPSGQKEQLEGLGTWMARIEWVLEFEILQEFRLRYLSNHHITTLSLSDCRRVGKRMLSLSVCLR